MNEAEAFERAMTLASLPDWQMRHGFRVGWQACCEWRDSQVGEPTLWMTEWWIEGGPDNGEYEYETNHSNEFSCGRKDGFPLYRHPPIAQINQQLVRALELAETEMRYAGWGTPVADNSGLANAYEAVVAGLAAAQMRGDA